MSDSNWGKGAINGIGWGQLATNDIGAGSIYSVSHSGETALIGVSAAFSYSASTFSQDDSDPTPKITGTTGGTFSGTSGLVFVSTLTGEIDLSASSVASHVVTYTVNGVSADFSLSVTAPAFSNQFSFEFDGVDEYFDLGTGYDYFNYETGSYSVSCWAKWTGNVFSKKIMNFATNQFKFGIFQGPQGVSFSIFKDNSQKLVKYNWQHPTIQIDDGNWHNICVVIYQNASVPTFDIYIDGDNAGSGGNTFLPMTVENTLSGSPPNSMQSKLAAGVGSLFACLDEVSIFNSALSSAAVTEIYNSGTPNNLNTLSNSSAPVAWFRMGENATFSNPGGVGDWTMVDQGSGTNNDGTSVNMEEADRKTNTP